MISPTHDVTIHVRRLCHLMGPKPSERGRMKADEAECSVTAPWRGSPPSIDIVWHRNAVGDPEGAWCCSACGTAEGPS